VIPTAVISAGSLAAGFAVAQATDVRALGGVVLVAGAAACTQRWRTRGAGVTTALLGTYVAAFVGSHVLAREIGAWPSVATVAAVTAAASWAVFDRSSGRVRASA
jgi:hypothetical protein